MRANPYQFIGRRHTTLPAAPRPVLHTTGAFTEAMKRVFIEPIRAQMNRQAFGAVQPDPWDDAMRWIEANEAAKAEWPWPARR